jgi:SAM-dependent methyltransferase
MRPDIVDLRDFYAIRLGQVSRHILRERIRTMWPDLRNMDVLGLGYATPYLQQFRFEARRVVAVMPSSQGVHRWPQQGRGLAALSDEADLPLPDASFDRILLVHSLENTEQVRGLLREVWRVLADGGRLLAVVPNRRGLWARFEATPFGHGHPYSPGQLSRLFNDTMFQPTARANALYLPPIRSAVLLKTAGAWERLGQRLGRPLGGVILMEAEKQIYAATPAGARVPRRRIAVALPGSRGAARQSTPGLDEPRN